MEKPTPRLTEQSNGTDAENYVGYDAILSKFHNPFEVRAMFETLGFENINFLWYHYHPAMPYLADADPQLF